MGISHPFYVERFLKHVRLECRRYKMKFTMIEGESISLDGGDLVGGYFCDDPLEIVIAYDNDTESLGWLHTLIHEFSHFEQYRDNDPTFPMTYKRTTADNIVEAWMNGKEYDEKTVNDCLDAQKHCELNCERRSVKNIEKYRLPIDIPSYCRQANAYVHFYNYLKMTRRWNTPNKVFPSEVPEIISVMPPHMNGNYTRMTKQMMSLYDQYLGYADA